MRETVFPCSQLRMLIYEFVRGRRVGNHWNMSFLTQETFLHHLVADYVAGVK